MSLLQYVVTTLYYIVQASHCAANERIVGGFKRHHSKIFCEQNSREFAASYNCVVFEVDPEFETAYLEFQSLAEELMEVGASGNFLSFIEPLEFHSYA